MLLFRKLSFNISMVLLLAQPVVALDVLGRSKAEGGHGSKEGLEVLYLFDQVSGDTIRANQGQLDLVVEDPNRVAFGSDSSGSFVDIKIETLIKSSTPATSIISACQANNELTIEMWLKNDKDDEPAERKVPLKILTLSSASNDANFFIGYNYDMAAQFMASVRVGSGLNASQLDPKNANYQEDENNHLSLNSGDTDENKVLQRDRFHHLMFTYNGNLKESRFYVSQAMQSSSVNIPIQRGPAMANNGSFSGWSQGIHLGIGNEITYNKDSNYPRLDASKPQTTEDRDWRGQIYLLAIYCKAHSSATILESAAPGASLPTYKPQNIPLTPEHIKAANIFNRVAGVKVPVTSTVIDKMAGFIRNNDGYSAALLATQEDSFFNITVRDFAKRMSTRDEVVNIELNDFVAGIIGVAKDDTNSQQLLTGNFYYAADPNLAAVPNNVVNDILRSNAHYESLEDNNYNLAKVLKRFDGQVLFNGTALEPHRDPAGIVTSRAFMGAHAVAGTNRRLVEFTFREFMCTPMEGWANSQGPDNWVGRDVDRFPGGDHSKFLTTCRACHSNMDGLRGSFSKFNFANGFVKYADIMAVANNANNENATNMFQDPVGIAGKMNRNSETFSTGIVVSNDAWINNSNLGVNKDLFGWQGPLTGRGVRGLGQMISKSEAFPKCMAKRVFRSLCKREVEALDESMIRRVASEYKNDDYNLRRLFARIIVTRECLGD